MEEQQPANVIVKSGLDELALATYLEEQVITREQIIAITEPEKGKFTLVFEGTVVQYETYQAHLAEVARKRGVLKQAVRNTFRRPQPYTIGGRR